MTDAKTVAVDALYDFPRDGYEKQEVDAIFTAWREQFGDDALVRMDGSVVRAEQQVWGEYSNQGVPVSFTKLVPLTEVNDG